MARTRSMRTSNQNDHASRAHDTSQAAGPSRAAGAYMTRSLSPDQGESRAVSPPPLQHDMRTANSDGQVVGLIQALTGLVQELRQQGNRGGQSSKMDRGITEFKKLAPPTFEGSTEPTESLKWLKEMEKVFVSMDCTDREKVRFAAYQLQGEASEWWDAVRRQYGNEEPITWDIFRQEFLDMYFPESLRFEKESEFTRLIQGGLTVTQYEAKFIELSRFAPELVATDYIKARRFEKGLKPRIRAGVRPMQLASYRDVVSKAKIVEQEVDNMQQERERQLRKRSRPDGQRGNQHSGKQPRQRGNQRQDPGPQQGNGPRCRRCQGFHLEQDCRWFSGACFNCGQQGHKAMNCPRSQNPGNQYTFQNAPRPPAPPPSNVPAFIQGQPIAYGSGERQKQKTQARVYALTQQDAQASNAVVTGNFASFFFS